MIKCQCVISKCDESVSVFKSYFEGYKMNGSTYNANYQIAQVQQISKIEVKNVFDRSNTTESMQWFD